MKLNQATINSFKAVYKAVFNTELEVEEANAKAVSLLEFIEAIYKPLPNYDRS